MTISIICAFLCIFLINYRLKILEKENKDLKILQKINSRNIEYLCYLTPELKEGQFTYNEYIRKYYGGEEDE